MGQDKDGKDWTELDRTEHDWTRQVTLQGTKKSFRDVYLTTKIF